MARKLKILENEKQTFAIGEAGATNAALYAVQILGTTDAVLADKLAAFRKAQNEKARNMTLPL